MSSLRAAVFITLILLLSVAAPHASAQSPMELSGSWQLNRAASQFPGEVGFSATFTTGVPGRPGEPRVQNQSAEDARRVRFLTDEVRNPYEHLALTITPAVVTIAFDRVAPRTFHPGRRDEEMMLGPVPGVATATWEGAHLVISYKAETGRLVRYIYSLNQSPRQLIVDVEFIERGGGDKVRRVYEPGPSLDTLAAPAAAPSAAAAAQTPAPPRAAAPLLSLPAAVPAAGDGASVDQRADAPLRGITRLGVVVEGLDADAQKCGLKQDVIENAVTKRLTDAGFRVMRDSDDDTYLYVNINTVTPSAGLCVSRYDVTLYSHTAGKLAHSTSSVLLQVELLHKG
ncbi:MAG: hypothetical protein ABMA00_23050, partial [Gemmatimonas sp.]